MAAAKASKHPFSQLLSLESVVGPAAHTPGTRIQGITEMANHYHWRFPLMFPTGKSLQQYDLWLQL